MYYPLVGFILAVNAFAAHHPVDAEPFADGQNVCNRTVPVKKGIIVQQPIEYKIKYQGQCGFLPCTKTKTEVRIDSQIKTTIVDVQVPGCCSGYAENPERQCVPICLNSCNNGKCIQPNVCKCIPEPTENSPGYVGSTCSRFVCLATNRWGSNCDRECNCPSTAYCSASTGKCLCRAGWRGANCTEECDSLMNCEGVELPPILEPDANVIQDSLGPMQRLQDLAPRALGRDSEQGDETPTATVGHPASFCYLYIILSATCCCLFILAMHYRLRLKEIRNELYASYASSTASSGGSDYMPPSNYTGTNRPRMPTPPESDYLSKNLSFDTAARNLILGKDSEPQIAGKESTLNSRFLLAPKVESHLMASKVKADRNLYSDVTIACNQLANSRSSLVNLIPKDSVQDFNRANQSLEDHDYQVPKSPARTVFLDDSTSFNNTSSNSYENDNSSNIYEEIKPRSSSEDGNKL